MFLASKLKYWQQKKLGKNAETVGLQINRAKAKTLRINGRSSTEI
jgi:hypothetical protein